MVVLCPVYRKIRAVLTLSTDGAIEAYGTHTLAIHTAASILALVTALAGVPHHLTALTCRGHRVRKVKVALGGQINTAVTLFAK